MSVGVVEIRRYPNRKLYMRGGYVSLRRVAEILRSGLSVEVTDTAGRDVTAYTLAQLVAQEAERGQKFDPEALVHLIRGVSAPRAAGGAS